MTGCGGGGAEIKATHTTMGEELHDIKKAFDQGIITEKEYNTSAFGFNRISDFQNMAC